VGALEPVPDAEVDAIHAVVERGCAYQPSPFLAKGMEVEVSIGPMMGVRGRLLRKERGLRVELSVTSIRQSVSAEIDATEVIPV
jgi:hypothetical protein